METTIELADSFERTAEAHDEASPFKKSAHLRAGFAVAVARKPPAIFRNVVMRGSIPAAGADIAGSSLEGSPISEWTDALHKLPRTRRWFRGAQMPGMPHGNRPRNQTEPRASFAIRGQGKVCEMPLGAQWGGLSAHSLGAFSERLRSQPDRLSARGKACGGRMQQVPHAIAYPRACTLADQDEGFEPKFSGLIAGLRDVPRGRSSRPARAGLPALSYVCGLEIGDQD